MYNFVGEYTDEKSSFFLNLIRGFYLQTFRDLKRVLGHCGFDIYLSNPRKDGVHRIETELIEFIYTEMSNFIMP